MRLERGCEGMRGAIPVGGPTLCIRRQKGGNFASCRGFQDHNSPHSEKASRAEWRVRAGGSPSGYTETWGPAAGGWEGTPFRPHTTPISVNGGRVDHPGWKGRSEQRAAPSNHPRPRGLSK